MTARKKWRGDVGTGVSAWLGDADRPPLSVGRPEAPPEDPVALGPDADPEAVARKILLDQLTGRARTRHELAGKLASKGVPDEVATRLLDRFTEVGLIDDAAFARQWVEQRQSGKGLARRALAEELRRKGVGADDAGAALDTVAAGDEEAAARALVRARMRRMAGLDRATATRRLAGLLARKGYGPAVAYAVVRSELDLCDGGPTDEAFDDEDDGPG